MKNFLTRKYTVEKVVWVQLLNSVLVSVILTYAFYLFVLYGKDILETLSKVADLETLSQVADDEIIVKQVVIRLFSVLLIVCLIIKLFNIAFEGGFSRSQKKKKK